MTIRRPIGLLLGLALLAGCGDSGTSSNESAQAPQPREAGNPMICTEGAEARQVSRSVELIGGSEVARGQIGDYLLQNDRIRVLIRQPGRQYHGTVNPYGGTIVDADICRNRSVPERSNFENSALGINIETIPHYTDVTILNDGANGEPAVIRATGPLDLFEYANPSSVIRDMGLQFPDSADDRPLPVDVQTDYILAPGKDYVREETRVFNREDQDMEIYLVEYLSGSGHVDAFVPGTGFGEPLATTSCPVSRYVPCADGSCDPCNFLAFVGYDAGRGVSYGRIHPYQGSSSMNVTGINVLAYGMDVLPVVLGLDTPNFTVPAEGELLIERYFAVTEGSVSNIQKVRNEIFGFETGDLEGVVTDPSGAPVSDALVAVIRENQDLELFALDEPDLQTTIESFSPERVLSTGSSVIGNLLDGQLPDGSVGTALAPELDVVSQDRTGADGQYHFELSPGTYEVLVYKEARAKPSPETAELTIETDAQYRQDFVLPSPGFMEVSVRDEAGRAIPAKVQLVGFEPNPPRANQQNIFGQVETRAGVFFDQFVRDPLPNGIAFVDFVGRDGTLTTREVPPGNYEVVVSRGPRYSAYRERVSIAERAVTAVEATLAQVVETPGFISADFHVHGIDSLDARIPRQDRVLTYLAEGVDFFTPSDHGFQIDFRETIRRQGVSDLIGTAPSAEATTMDYGHYNAWPRTVLDDVFSGGYVDWGWGDEVPPGRRFPVFGNYLKPPEGLIAAAKTDPMTRPIVQINHVDSFFRDVGLGVDTGVSPPQSTVDPLTRRLDPALDNLFADNFDALEIWIGERGRKDIDDEEGNIHENLADWFNLINQGIVRTAVASSDSHTRRLTAMSTRSMVASDVTDPGRLTGHAQALADNVADGRVVMTNAPFVTLEATASSTGASAGLARDQEKELHTSDGRATLKVRIQSPEWAEFDRVDLFINNAPEQTSEDPPRYRACEDVRIPLDESDIQRVEVVPGLDGAVRLEAEVTHTLESLEQDTWIVARVAGTPGRSEPLFPVEPNSIETAESDEGDTTLFADHLQSYTRALQLEDLTGSNIGQGGVMAYAVTNPLFIDIDGDGWSAPGVRVGDCD